MGNIHSLSDRHFVCDFFPSGYQTQDFLTQTYKNLAIYRQGDKIVRIYMYASLTGKNQTKCLLKNARKLHTSGSRKVQHLIL